MPVASTILWGFLICSKASGYCHVSNPYTKRDYADSDRQAVCLINDPCYTTRPVDWSTLGFLAVQANRADLPTTIEKEKATPTPAPKLNRPEMMSCDQCPTGSYLQDVATIGPARVVLTCFNPKTYHRTIANCKE